MLNEKFGYPESKILRIKNSASLAIMYYHLSRIEKYDELKELIFNQLKAGKAAPFEMESLISSRYLHFYHHLYFGDDDKSLGFKIIKSDKPKDTFNMRRKKYRLPSLQYVKRKDSLLNIQ